MRKRFVSSLVVGSPATLERPAPATVRVAEMMVRLTQQSMPVLVVRRVHQTAPRMVVVGQAERQPQWAMPGPEPRALAGRIRMLGQAVVGEEHAAMRERPMRAMELMAVFQAGVVAAAELDGQLPALSAWAHERATVVMAAPVKS